MTSTRARVDLLPITGVEVDVYEVPTDTLESDGTLAWDSTTAVVAHVEAGDVAGLGWTYGHDATATLIHRKLADVIVGHDAMNVRARWLDLYRACRNLGRPGIASHAISALDIALWDAKARAMDVPMVDLLGAARGKVPIYGSGGFTSYDLDRLTSQLRGWVEAGITQVKIKVGRHPDEDGARVAAARQAIGTEAGLFVDANGAYTVQQALRQASVFAAGEYAYDAFHVRDLVEAEAIDVAQADVTRCGGITGFLDMASYCWAANIDLSAHTALQLSLQAGAAAPRIRHIEYFHDHVRLEDMLFDGVVEPVEGALHPDRSRPGHGLAVRRSDAEEYRV